MLKRITFQPASSEVFKALHGSKPCHVNATFKATHDTAAPEAKRAVDLQIIFMHFFQPRLEFSLTPFFLAVYITLRAHVIGFCVCMRLPQCGQIDGNSQCHWLLDVRCRDHWSHPYLHCEGDFSIHLGKGITFSSIVDSKLSPNLSLKCGNAWSAKPAKAGLTLSGRATISRDYHKSEIAGPTISKKHLCD